jgi:hypothetical protein
MVEATTSDLDYVRSRNLALHPEQSREDNPSTLPNIRIYCFDELCDSICGGYVD